MQALFDPNLLPGQKVEQKFELTDEIKEQLNELYEKGINISELLKELLEKRKQEIQEEKEEIAEQSKPTNSRYIKAATKNVIKKEFGTKCAMPNCKSDSQEIHHTNRFSLSHQHNPYYLAPLCKNQHQIAHSIDLKFQENRKIKIS